MPTEALTLLSAQSDSNHLMISHFNGDKPVLCNRITPRHPAKCPPAAVDQGTSGSRSESLLRPVAETSLLCGLWEWGVNISSSGKNRSEKLLALADLLHSPALACGQLLVETLCSPDNGWFGLAAWVISLVQPMRWPYLSAPEKAQARLRTSYISFAIEDGDSSLGFAIRKADLMCSRCSSVKWCSFGSQ